RHRRRGAAGFRRLGTLFTGLQFGEAMAVRQAARDRILEGEAQRLLGGHRTRRETQECDERSSTFHGSLGSSGDAGPAPAPAMRSMNTSSSDAAIGRTATPADPA